MSPEYQLISFHIIEKFINNKSLITWSYPNISEDVKSLLLQKTLVSEAELFVYFRTNNDWVYIWNRYGSKKTYALALVTKIFNPNKYDLFGRTLCEKYEKGYNPVDLVQIYLGLFTKGVCTIQENGSKRDLNFENKVQIKDLIRLFGVEIILIYNALLLKKRVFVYHSDLVVLQKLLLSITNLMDSKLRNPTDYLIPFVKHINTELKGKTFFVAGIIDKNMNIKSENYDLFVNLITQEINISSNSKEIFAMTKIHKEIAVALCKFSEEPEYEDSLIIQELHSRTKGILNNLNSLAMTQTIEKKPMITLEELRSKKLTSVMENFLFNLAVAENIMML